MKNSSASLLLVAVLGAVSVPAVAGMVTQRGSKQQVELKVSDPSQLKLVKVGDQVHAVYTEALALSVEPVSKL